MTQACLGLDCSLLRWGSVSPPSHLSHLPKELTASVLSSPCFLPSADCLLPTSLCEYHSCKAWGWPCNHVTYFCFFLLFAFVLQCFSSTFWELFFVSILQFFCTIFLLYLFPHPLISFNIGVFPGFILILLSSLLQIVSSALMALNCIACRPKFLNLCLQSLSLNLISASWTGAGLGQRALFSVSFRLLQQSWGISRFHGSCISYPRKLWLRRFKNRPKVSCLICLLDRATWASFRCLEVNTAHN